MNLEHTQYINDASLVYREQREFISIFIYDVYHVAI